MPSTRPQASPDDVSFEVRTPAPEGDTHLGWPRPVSGRVGPYELLEEIAQGGMGVVYKARDTRLGRVVALKTMRADALRQPGSLPRFRREMQAAAQLSHPNIVAVYEVGDHHGQPFYTMAYLPGGSLAGRREQMVDEPRLVAGLMEKIARAVQHAHERSVFHRDLKPGNVLLDERGEPQIADFGLAKFRGAELELTQTGAVLGTVPYMAPEQAAGRKDVGPAADVWALGVMLYELVTGQRPFTGDSGEEVKRKILAEQPPRPRRVRPRLDRDLETILFRCLEKRAEDRYPSAGALADDLRRFVQGEPVVPPSRAARLVRFVRRHRWACALLLVSGLAAAALALYRYETNPDRQLDRYRRQWAAGKKLVLIGDDGRCAWHRWVLQAAGISEAPAYQEFQLKSGESLSLLELIPSPPAEGYRFRAKIKQSESAGEGGLAGIYFGRTSVASSHGENQALCALLFKDMAKVSRRVELSTWHLVGVNQHPTSCKGKWIIDPYFSASIVALFDSPSGSLLAASPILLAGRMSFGYPHPLCWRDVAIEVTPVHVRAFWMNELLGDIDTEALRTEFERGRNPAAYGPLPQPYVKPEFEPRNGLGLCIGRGRATFRDVVVESLEGPLSAEE